MPVIISNKSRRFKHFELHHLSFKNVNANQFNEIYDAVNEYLFTQHAIIVSSTLTGNRADAKTIKKAAKKVFDEVNWPLNWVGNTKDSNFSGDFVAVSGVNVKAFISANFITKVFDTPDARYVFVGDVLNDNKESKLHVEEVHNTVNYALSMVGLSSTNIVRSVYYCENVVSCKANLLALTNNETIITDNQAIAEIIIKSGNQHQKKLMASFFAIQPKNDNLTIETVKSLNENNGAVLVSDQFSEMLMISRSFDTLIKSNETNGENSIEKALNSIEALIQDNGFTWSQLWRSIAYFNDVNDMAFFKKICKEKQIPMSSMLIVQTERDGEKNLFDIEADFVKTNEE